MIVTIPERKAQAVARLSAAATLAKADLAAYALEHGGSFTIFGSFARGEIRPGSDFDVMADFAVDLERDARDAAETICRAHGLVPDVHLRSEVSDSLMKRISRDGVALP